MTPSTATAKFTPESAREGVPIGALRALKRLSSEDRRTFVHLVEAAQLYQPNSDAGRELLQVSKGLLHVCQQLPHPGDVVAQYQAMQCGLDAIERRSPPSLTTSLSWNQPIYRAQLVELEQFLSYHFVFFVQSCSRLKVACTRFNAHGVLDYLVERAQCELQSYKGKVALAWKEAATFIHRQSIDLPPGQELDAASVAQLRRHADAFFETLARTLQRVIECLAAFYSQHVACNQGKRIGYEAMARLARVAGPKMRFYDAIEQIRGPFGTRQILEALDKMGTTHLDSNDVASYLKNLGGIDLCSYNRKLKAWNLAVQRYQQTGFGKPPVPPVRRFHKTGRHWNLNYLAFKIALRHILWQEEHDPIVRRTVRTR